MAQCYKCGAYPHHPNKTLDTLKLIQCLDCQTIACMRHRDGIIGGKCPKCGSSRSIIAAFRTGEMSKHDGIGTIGGPAGGSATPNSVDSESTKISKNTLKNMQQTRINAIKEIELKKHHEKKQIDLAKAAKNAIFIDDSGPAANPMNIKNYHAKNEKPKDSEKLKQMLGDRKLIMDKCPDESIGKVKNSIPTSSSLIGVIASAQFAERKFNQSSPEDEDNLDFSFAEEQDEKTYHVKIKNNFHPIEEESFNIEDMLEQQDEIKIEILELLSEIFTIEPEHLCLSMSSNLFIPLQLIDKFMILEEGFYRKNNINIITGIRGSSLTPDLVDYLNLFKEFIHHKPFIDGILGEFGDSVYYNTEEQKEVMISLLDVAFENNKTFYISANEDTIENWINLFNEYDLSSLNFVFTSLVTNEKMVDFIKTNEIKLLITANAEIDFYKKHFLDYLNNLIIGSGDDLFGLLKVIEGMHVFDKNFKEKLIKK